MKLNTTYSMTGKIGESFQKVMEAVENKSAFILKCKVSAVLFNPKTLTAHWYDKTGEGPVFYYDNYQSYTDGIRLQLFSHDDFVAVKEIEEIKNVLLLL